MASSVLDSSSDIPQWKKDLIARLRSNQNKSSCSVDKNFSTKQLSTNGSSVVTVTDPTTITTTGSDFNLLDPSRVNNNNSNSSKAVAGPSATSVAVGQTPNDVINLTSACGFSKSSAFEGETSETVRRAECKTAGATCVIIPANKMVQERIWLENKTQQHKMSLENYKNSDSSDSEDLHYGPGIVNKLKNKYLSLALRETNSRRPSILRKAASLENILDDEGDKIENNKKQPVLFQSRLNGAGKNVSQPPNRYRNATRTRTPEMKRARSVEAISSTNLEDSTLIRSKRESMPEEMLIKGGNDGAPDKPAPQNENKTSFSSNRRINKPKRIAPMMNEKEKPPVDVVKQTKLIFEKRPEQRTKPPQSTGEVAAKVATYKNIIVKNKQSLNKPPIKNKPRVLVVPDKSDKKKFVKQTGKQEAISPIPDVSMIEFIGNKNGTESGESHKNKSSLSETPDLILTSSLQKQQPIVTSPTFKISATENFIQQERRHSDLNQTKDESDGGRAIQINPNTIKFNFSESNAKKTHLPTTNKNVLNSKTPPNEPLKLELNGIDNNDIISKKVTSNNTRVLQVEKKENKPEVLSPKILSPRILSPVNLSPRVLSPTSLGAPPKIVPQSVKPAAKAPLTNTEIEKNLKNSAKSLSVKEKPKSAVASSESAERILDKIVVEPAVNKNQVPNKVKRTSRATENSCMEYNFTDRKGTPDYIRNDTSRTPVIERPKAGESGIILLPGASIGESFTDEEEEIIRSLEAPPSPCDVKFINDNILIDGKSSLSQKTKKPKMRIKFVDDGPEIYEYPSETSMLIDDLPSATPVTAQVGHTVPQLSGSSLANYTPKVTEEFQPGVSRHNVPTKNETADNSADLVLEEMDQPILFSAGTNSDILF